MLAAGSSGVELRQRGLLVGRLREFAGAERMTGLIAAPTHGRLRPSPEWPPQMAAASVVSVAVAPIMITRLGRRAFPQGSSAMLSSAGTCSLPPAIPMAPTRNRPVIRRALTLPARSLRNGRYGARVLSQIGVSARFRQTGDLIEAALRTAIFMSRILRHE